jgi:hypothetical protein
MGIVTVGLLVLGFSAFVLSGSRCPVFLTVAGKEPSGVLDDNGEEFQVLTVRMNNRDSGELTVAEEGIHGEAKVGNHWVKARVLSTVLDVRRYRDVLVVVPYNAEDCRLSIEYLPVPLNLRFMSMCARLGLWRLSLWRALATRCFPVGWLEPLRSDYIGTSPHWKHVCPEVSCPPKPGPLSGAPAQVEPSRLSVGDTVQVHVDMEPQLIVPAESASKKVAADGTIGLWGTQRVQVAGLTPDQAADRVRLALITNYFGINFRKVAITSYPPKME